ncbi:50S ribosomal protein L10 [Candidatus Nomurabacteria bacterium]|nr:50S ribosomal protein L10 [Candidatus Nomurabacteria bacterium]
MAKTRQQKQETAERLQTGIASAKSVVFANYQGLTVSAMEELRSKCREQGIEVLAAKKTLVKRALADNGMDVDIKAFEGSVAAFMGMSDEVAPAKVVNDFAKTNELVTIFGGVLEGAYIQQEKVKALASLPSKEELYAKIVGSINAPVSGFVNVLAGNLRGLVTALNAIKDQKA